jgi:DNA ligase (NAD+)
MQQLEDLEADHPDLVTEDSPTQRVAGEPIEGFRTIRHAVPMLSVDNTYSREDLDKFDERVRKNLGHENFTYLVDPKIDGVAVNLRYEGRMLVLAASRGDGKEGDDITSNVRTIRSVPLNLGRHGLPDVVEVRGEIYWPRKSFAAYNERRKEQGLESFANPRNGAAGTLKQLDPRAVAERNLAFVAHGIGEMSERVTETAEELFEMLRVCGVPINRHARTCKNIDEVWDAIQDWEAHQHQADFESDGMVVKVNELTLRDELGATSKYPRWCIAYKYETARAETLLRDVSFQVGRTGVVTPVAHFEPVALGGTTVSNASLHNFDNVHRLGVRVGDTVIVEKAGEIIPQVVGIAARGDASDVREIEPPATCPACDAPTQRDDGGVYLRCSNPTCPARLREQLTFFAGRNQMNIADLGPIVIDELVKQGKLTCLGDLYRLKIEDIIGIQLKSFINEKGTEVQPTIQKPMAKKILQAIEVSKSRGLTTVLMSIGVPKIGQYWAEEFAKRFRSAKALCAASQADLRGLFREREPKMPREIYDYIHRPDGAEAIRDVPFTTDDLAASPVPHLGQTRAAQLVSSEIITSWNDLKDAQPQVISDALGIAWPEYEIADSLYTFLHEECGCELLAELANLGVNVEYSAVGNEQGALKGKTVVVTGSIEGLSRKEVQNIVRRAGGNLKTTVSGETDILVVGEKPGSEKLKKAAAFETKKIRGAEFLKTLGIDLPPHDDADDKKPKQGSLF